MGNPYGIIGWEYPYIKGVEYPSGTSRVSFPGWLKNRALDCLPATEPADTRGYIFCAFDEEKDNPNTAIHAARLREEPKPYVFLGNLRKNRTWDVYRLDAEKILSKAGSEHARININMGNLHNFCKGGMSQPILREQTEGGNAQ